MNNISLRTSLGGALGEQVKPFLGPGEVLKILNTNRSQLQNLLPYLPHIYVGERGTHLFPTGYIQALNQFLQGRTPTIALVSTFNQTPEASQQVLTAIQGLQSLLESNSGGLTVAQVATLLGLGLSTVWIWAQLGVVTAVITPQSLKECLKWQMP